MSADVLPAAEAPRWRPAGAGVSGPVRVTVVVDEGAVDTVAAALRTAGLQIDQVLGSIGVVTGAVPADRQGALAGVAGVVSVTEDRPYQLPPPDAPVQ